MTLGIWITGCFKLLPQNIIPAPADAAGALPLALHIKTSVASPIHFDFPLKYYFCKIKVQ